MTFALDASTSRPFPFDNSYARLPQQFYTRQAPSQAAEPWLIKLNEPLAEELGLDVQALRRDGIEIAASCEQGVCGTCLTPVLEGRVEHRDAFLTAQEQALHDQFLPCCSRALGEVLTLDL